MVWIPVILLCLGALRLHNRTALAPAAAYLAMLLGALTFLSAAALFNLLLPAILLLFAGILALTARDLHRQGLRAWAASARAFLTRPVLLALLAGAVLAVVYALQQPVLVYWDEYYIWGVNAKQMFFSHQLYTLSPGSSDVYHPCGAPMLCYLFQFFCPHFVEADLYLSYAFFYFAVFAAAAELVEAAAGGQTATLFFLALTLSPLFENYHSYTQDYRFISYGYATVMTDYLLAVASFACVVLYLAAPKGRWYYLGLAYAALVKETGVLPALLMAALLAVWRFLPARPAGEKPGIGAWFGRTVADMAVPAGCYVAWLVHVALVGPMRAAGPWPGAAVAVLLCAAALLRRRMPAAKGGPRGAAPQRDPVPWLRRYWPAVALPAAALALGLLAGGYADVVLRRFRALLSICLGFLVPAMRSTLWQETINIFRWAFFRESTLLFCRDVLLVAGLWLAAVAAALAGRGKKGAWPLAATQLFLTLGAAVYLYVISYFVADFLQTLGMVEYGRYFSTYLYVWLYIIALALLLQLGQGWPSRIAALAGAAACLAAVGNMGLKHTVIMAPDNYKLTTENWMARTALARQTLRAGDHVFLICEPRDTESYLRALYYLYPALVAEGSTDTDVDYTIAYRAAPDPDDADSQGCHIASEEEFGHMLQRNFEYVFVAGDAENYARDYGALFEGGVEADVLYRVTAEAAAPLRRVEGDTHEA